MSNSVDKPVLLQVSLADQSLKDAPKARRYWTVLAARMAANQLLRDTSAIYCCISDDRDGRLYTCGRYQQAWSDGDPLPRLS